jgi:hypothetical protein
MGRFAKRTSSHFNLPPYHNHKSSPADKTGGHNRARKSRNGARGHDFTKVTAPSEAEETSAAYLENTPRL